MATNVSLKAILEPEVDEQAVEQEMSSLQDVMDDFEFSMGPGGSGGGSGLPSPSIPNTLKNGAVRQGVGRAIGRGTGRMLPGKLGTAAGSVFGEVIAGTRGSDGTGGGNSGEGPTDRETGESLADLAVERNAMLEDMRDAIAGGAGGNGGGGSTGGGFGLGTLLSGGVGAGTLGSGALLGGVLAGGSLIDEEQVQELGDDIREELVDAMPDDLFGQDLGERLEEIFKGLSGNRENDPMHPALKDFFNDLEKSWKNWTPVKDLQSWWDKNTPNKPFKAIGDEIDSWLEEINSWTIADNPLTDVADEVRSWTLDDNPLNDVREELQEAVEGINDNGAGGTSAAVDQTGSPAAGAGDLQGGSEWWQNAQEDFAGSEAAARGIAANARTPGSPGGFQITDRERRAMERTGVNPGYAEERRDRNRSNEQTDSNTGGGNTETQRDTSSGVSAGATAGSGGESGAGVARRNESNDTGLISTADDVVDQVFKPIEDKLSREVPWGNIR